MRSYWQIFRLIFVIFSLYLLSDIFYRWDGFMYYGSFTDFLPSVALIIILWTSIAILTAMLIWLLIKLVEFFSIKFGWKVNAGYLIINICMLVFLTILIWLGIEEISHDVLSQRMRSILIYISIVLITIILSWLFRNKVSLIHERIAPLVWLYGTLLILSLPLLALHIWENPSSNKISKQIIRSSSLDTSRPNIILVTFDALTAQKMSAYGYNRETTPFITKWAKNASKFTKAEAEATYTAPTTASLMTGKRVWTHQLYQPHGYKIINASTENLPLLLKNNGYFNMALIQNTYASVGTLDIAKSFDVVYPVNELVLFNSLSGFIDLTLYKYFSQKIILYDWLIRRDFLFGKIMNFVGRFLPDKAGKEYPPDKVFNRFLWFIKKKPPEPLFAWIHIMPPHDPYLPPEPYMGMFDSSSKLRTFKSQTHKNKYNHIDITRARYDEFIKYCDKEFENFIKELENHFKNTVIILSSDHGESFEHDYIGHGGPHLYEHLTNIPLIIKEPNQSKGRVIDDPVEQIDIASTILDLAHIEAPSWMEGQSLVPIMRGKELPTKPVISMSVFSTPRGQKIIDGTFAIWEDNYKLIHYLGNNKSLLFNLKEDPDETNNLFKVEPELGQRLLTLINDNLEEANEKIKNGE